MGILSWLIALFCLIFGCHTAVVSTTNVNAVTIGTTSTPSTTTTTQSTTTTSLASSSSTTTILPTTTTVNYTNSTALQYYRTGAFTNGTWDRFVVYALYNLSSVSEMQAYLKVPFLFHNQTVHTYEWIGLQNGFGNDATLLQEGVLNESQELGFLELVPNQQEPLANFNSPVNVNNTLFMRIERLGNSTTWNLFIFDLTANMTIINNDINYAPQFNSVLWATEDHNNTSTPKLLELPMFYNSSIRFSNGTIERISFNST